MTIERPFPAGRHLVRWAALALAVAAALPAQAQWKWRDANGRITASDLPPPREVAEKDILQRPQRSTARLVVNTPSAASAAAAAPAASAAVARPVPPPVDKELDARRRAAEQEAKAKAKAEEERVAALRADNCKRARSHLATMESGQRIARINDKGEREVLDDAARAEEARRARDVIASDCRP